MGACVSLGRAAGAPCRRALDRLHPKKEKQAAAASASAAAPPSEGASSSAAAAAAAAQVQLGFPGGFDERYELVRELGRGQFATVHEARERRTRERVAVKCIPKRLLVARDAARDIRREVSILRALAGKPHVVRLRDVFEDDQAVQLVLELCTGGELFQRVVALGHLPEQRAAVLMRCVLTFVAECHLAGVMHRDIKPENFMYRRRDDDASLVAIDFGTATYFAPGQLFSDVVGSVHYVAPEVLRRRYGPAADIWSCGVLLYVLLSGTLPFHGTTEAGTYASVLSAPLDTADHEPWRHVSSDAKQLLRALLRRNPAARLTAAQALSHPWIRGATGRAAPPRVPLDSASLTAVSRFASRSALQRSALRALAATLPAAELRHLRDQYATLDADGDGRVTRAEVAAALQRLSHVARDAAAAAAADDTTNSGDAAAAADDAASSASASASDVASDTPDDDIHPVGTLLSDADLATALDAVDADGDGLISFEDFAASALRPSHIWPAEDATSSPAAVAAARARWRAHARAAFDRLDRNGDGFVDCADLAAVVGAAEAAACFAGGALEQRRLSFRDFRALLRAQAPGGASGETERQLAREPPPADEAAERAAAAGARTAQGAHRDNSSDEDEEDAQARQLEATARQSAGA